MDGIGFLSQGETTGNLSGSGDTEQKEEAKCTLIHLDPTIAPPLPMALTIMSGYVTSHLYPWSVV